MNAPARAAVFLDKDGTLVEDIPYNVDPRLLRFTPGVAAGLRRLHDAGFLLVVVSNQSGIARGRFTEAQFALLQAAMRQRLRAAAGVELAAFEYCPHAPDAGCECRKPRPGMLRRAACAHGICLERSWMIGDILDDVEAGRRAGCRTVLVDRGGEREWRPSPLRDADHVCNGFAAATAFVLRHSPAADRR